MHIIRELEALIAATKPSHLRFQTVALEPCPGRPERIPSQELVVHEVAQRAIDAILVNRPLQVDDKVFLTFSEARGRTGVVTDVGRDVDRGYDYADVRLDDDGTQTGPLPVTCVRRRRAADVAKNG